jgi:outer membrane receptor protein involved in Fe transport
LGLAFGLACVEGVYADAATEPTDQIPEIIVTATKRESTVQDTAASITAISAADIADRGIVDFNSLAQSVPGISMRTSGPGQTEFEMRGLNSAGGNTSQVGFYLDETPLSAPAAAQLGKEEIDPSLYDLGRVEVLRGPQGTLYGSSSMGGTVKLVPNAPEIGVFSASGENVISDTGSGGNINQKVNGMVNLPLGDTAAVRFVGTESSDSGWIKRLVIQDGAVGVDTGSFGAGTTARPANFYTAPLQEEIDGANTTTIDSARVSLLWKPTDNFTITPMLMWQLTQQAAPDTVDVNGNPTHPTAPQTSAHWEIYDSAEPQRDRFTLASLKLVYQFDYFSLTSATADWNRNTLVSQDSTEENAAALSGAFGPGTLGQYDFGCGAGGCGVTPLGIGPTGPAPNGPSVTEKDFTRQISEELRATSSGSGPFQWIIGYFYQDLYSEWDEWAIAPQATAIFGGPNLYVDHQPQTIIQNSEFGEASWQFTPDLKATVGARHYHYSLGQTNSEFGVFTEFGNLGENTTPLNTASSNSASGTDPKFDLSYNITKDVLVYATVAKGFRLGGVNQPIPVADPGPGQNSALVGNECGLQLKILNIPIAKCLAGSDILLQAPKTFSPDQVWNYEIGEKSSFLDRRVIADVSAYFERWTNPQIATNLAGFGLTANGADARVVGFEAQLQALLTPEWNVGFNAGYTDSKFTANSAITGYPSGYQVPDIPKITASATVRWKHPLTSELALLGTLEEDYVGNRTDAPYGETVSLQNINNYLLHLPAYALTNLRFGVAGGAWTATFFVDNLTNKEALLDPQPQIDLQTNAFVRYLVNRPRTGGIDLTYKFH